MVLEGRCCFVDKNEKQKPNNVSLRGSEYSSLTHTNNQKLRETSINKQHFTFFLFFRHNRVKHDKKLNHSTKKLH